MTDPFLKKFRPKPLHTDEAKVRRCLKCRKRFISSWPGERVCPTCKTTPSWREGITLGRLYR